MGSQASSWIFWWALATLWRLISVPPLLRRIPCAAWCSPLRGTCALDHTSEAGPVSSHPETAFSRGCAPAPQAPLVQRPARASCGAGRTSSLLLSVSLRVLLVIVVGSGIGFE